VEREFADRTMRVIVEKAEPFYAVRPDIYYAGFFKGVSRLKSSRATFTR
jgi:hypothetical protein